MNTAQFMSAIVAGTFTILLLFAYGVAFNEPWISRCAVFSAAMFYACQTADAMAAEYSLPILSTLAFGAWVLSIAFAVVAILIILV